MGLILNIIADKDDAKKAKIRYNNSDWSYVGSPTYSDTVYPPGFTDSFYLDYYSYLVSSTNSIFNLHNKNFTITWWEYNTTDLRNGTATINLGLNEVESWLLLSYPNFRCYAGSKPYDFNPPYWEIFDGWYCMGSYTMNQWINFAFVSEFKNNIHTFRTYRDGNIIGERTSSITFPDVGNLGRMYVGGYYNIENNPPGPNRYLQNIRMYNEALFSDTSYNIFDYEDYGECNKIFSLFNCNV